MLDFGNLGNFTFAPTTGTAAVLSSGQLSSATTGTNTPSLGLPQVFSLFAFENAKHMHKRNVYKKFIVCLFVCFISANEQYQQYDVQRGEYK